MSTFPAHCSVSKQLISNRGYCKKILDQQTMSWNIKFITENKLKPHTAWCLAITQMIISDDKSTPLTRFVCQTPFSSWWKAFTSLAKLGQILCSNYAWTRNKRTAETFSSAWKLPRRWQWVKKVFTITVLVSRWEKFLCNAFTCSPSLTTHVIQFFISERWKLLSGFLKVLNSFKQSLKMANHGTYFTLGAFYTNDWHI